MNSEKEKYPQDKGCVLHPRCAPDHNGQGGCPEPICAFEFPGGLNAYLRFKAMRKLLESGMDINEAAASLMIHKQTAQRRFNKAGQIRR